MSRSRKKFPAASDYSRASTRFYKNQANRVIRRYKKGIPDGSSYKKLYCTWNICDYKFVFFDKKWDEWWGPKYKYHK